MYVRTSHSEPLGKPTGLTIGALAKGNAIFGVYLGENSFSERHVPRIPILVFGNTNHPGLPNVVEKSNINCVG